MKQKLWITLLTYLAYCIDQELYKAIEYLKTQVEVLIEQQVWNEIARVLRPGGKVCVSDLALKKTLPEAVREMVVALVVCVADAVTIDETIKMAGDAGLVNISMVNRQRTDFQSNIPRIKH